MAKVIRKINIVLSILCYSILCLSKQQTEDKQTIAWRKQWKCPHKIGARYLKRERDSSERRDLRDKSIVDWTVDIR